jgi:hypothetical protein
MARNSREGWALVVYWKMREETKKGRNLPFVCEFPDNNTKKKTRRHKFHKHFSHTRRRGKTKGGKKYSTFEYIFIIYTHIKFGGGLTSNIVRRRGSFLSRIPPNSRQSFFCFLSSVPSFLPLVCFFVFSS